MRHHIIDTGRSRSFPPDHVVRSTAAHEATDAEVVIVIGAQVGRRAASLPQWKDKIAVLLELGTECLGVYTGESRGEEGSNVLGFARFRLGDGEPSNLVELVRQPRTNEAALRAAKQVFEAVTRYVL